MLPREQYIFRGCILLFAIVVSLLALFFLLIWGKPADLLNRLGIMLEMVGILAVLPEIIGENRLQKAFSDLNNIRSFRINLKEYLYRTRPSSNQSTPLILIILSITGNLIMSMLLITVWIGIIIKPFQDKWLYTSLVIIFSFLGLLSIIWILLFLCILLLRSRMHKVPMLVDLFVAINSLTSALGVLISSALAYLLLMVILPIFRSVVRIPFRKLITIVTIPFLVIGAILQIVATFL
jgi:hypothetical protein